MKHFPLLSISLLVIILSGGCRTKGDTIAIVKVRNSLNQPITNAQVILDGGTIRSMDTAFTNSSGDAIFNYNDLYQLGQHGVGIFEIRANSNGNYGNGTIKVEQETTTTEIVFL